MNNAHQAARAERATKFINDMAAYLTSEIAASAAEDIEHDSDDDKREHGIAINVTTAVLSERMTARAAEIDASVAEIEKALAEPDADKYAASEAKRGLKELRAEAARLRFTVKHLVPDTTFRLAAGEVGSLFGGRGY